MKTTLSPGVSLTKGQPTVSAGYLKARLKPNRYPRAGRPPYPLTSEFYHPSRKGEFPHKDTGNLRRNMNEEEDLRVNSMDSKVRVGTNVPYAKTLELTMQRLLLRATLTREENALRQIIEQGKI